MPVLLRKGGIYKLQNNQTALQKCQFENNDNERQYTTVYFWCMINAMWNFNEEEALKRLGYRIRFFRTLKGWSQAALAKKVGISVSYTGNIENALRPSVSFIIISKIAIALDVTPNELLL